MRKQDDLSNRVRAGQCHHQSVNSNSNPACGRHTMFQREQKIFVEVVHFLTNLFHEPAPLNQRVVQLRIPGRNLLTVDDQFVDVD